jgi:hypothetical protein
MSERYYFRADCNNGGDDIVTMARRQWQQDAEKNGVMA